MRADRAHAQVTKGPRETFWRRIWYFLFPKLIQSSHYREQSRALLDFLTFILGLGVGFEVCIRWVGPCAYFSTSHFNAYLIGQPATHPPARGPVCPPTCAFPHSALLLYPQVPLLPAPVPFSILLVTRLPSIHPSVSVCSGCHSKTPQTGSLKQHLFSHSSGAYKANIKVPAWFAFW